MLGSDSALRRLPPQLERRQMLLFDALRHAAEIVDLGYRRLQHSLTAIAEAQVAGDETKDTYTAAFLDAWAMIDAIYKIRGILINLDAAGFSEREPADGSPKATAFTETIAKVRNIGDHIVGTADQIIAASSTALGILSWFTPLDTNPARGVSCVLAPGTIADLKASLVNPLGQECDLPSGLITLQAGKYKVSLSDAFRSTVAVVERIEVGLDHVFKEKGVQGQHAGSDMLLVGVFEFAPAARPT